MDYWNNIESLKSLSHFLMGLTIVCSLLAPTAVGIRYYVDRRERELTAKAQDVRESELKNQIDTAQRDQKAAREELAKVEKKLKGRHLTEEQAEQLTSMAQAVCDAIPFFNVTAAPSNHEAQLYGTEITKALKRGGCAREFAIPTPGLLPEVMGIHIGVLDTTNIPDGATVLSKLLDHIGIKHTFSNTDKTFLSGLPFLLAIGGLNEDDK